MTEENNQSGAEATEEKQLTDKQLQEIRNRMIKYYQEQNTVLAPQAKYETLLADIEEARARRMQMSIRLAQMMAGPKEPEKKPETETPNQQQS